MAGRDIKFKVKLLDQSVQELELDASMLCSDVKLVLEALTNIPAIRQRLIYRGRVLRDDQSLQDAGIEDGNAIHLIERMEPPAGATGAAGSGATAAGAGAGAPDLNRLLQGVFSAIGGGFTTPPAGSGPAAAAAAGPQQQQQGRSSSGGEPTHLLRSIADYLQQLQSQGGPGAAAGAAQETAMPVTSLALGGTTGTQQLQNALTAALQHILAGQPLSAEQQAQLAAAAAGAAATAGAAAAGAGTTGTYPHMGLVLCALCVLLTRAQAYLNGPLAQGLAAATQQLAQLTQQQGVNGPEASRILARISGQLQSAAALLVELARAASASSVEVSGSNPLLTANTAAVLQQQQQQGGGGGRLVPAFPTLYPQLPPGMAGERGPTARGTTVALPDFSNPADIIQFAGRLTNTVLTGLGTGITAANNSGSNAAAAAPQQQQAGAGGPGAAAGAAGAPSSAQIAQMVAAALTSSLAPVIERVSADVAGPVRAGRDSISSGQFENASTAAATTATNIAAQTVSTTVGRVLTSVTQSLNRNLSSIEQRLQEVERESGRQVNAVDIAAAVQQVLLPHMQPLGDVLGAAARAAASSAAAANAAAATAAQEAANAAAAAGQAANAAAAAGQAANAAAGTPGAAAAGSSAPAAASAPPAPAAAAAAAGEAGPSSSRGAQPRGLGLGAGLRSGALPAKRKAQGSVGAAGTAPDSSADAPAAAVGGGSVPRGMSGTSAGSSGHRSPAAAAAGGGGGVGGPAPGAAGRGAPPPDLGALMQMMMGGAAAGDGSSGQPPRQQQQQPPAGGGGGGDLAGLMQMMGGMLGGGGAAGGGGGGMGGLLQMAGQIASDPAMQPLISGVASAVLGGGGQGLGGGGAGGGLGGLLGGLLGGGGGMGAPGGSGARSATVVASMDDLEHELPDDVASQWRRVLEQDERAQAAAMARGRGPLSEVYQAGAPTASRRSIIPGLPV